MKKFLVIAGILLACSSHASVELNSAFEDLKLELIDLDPFDAIAPSITVYGGTAWGAINISLLNGFTEEYFAETPLYQDAGHSVSTPSIDAAFERAGNEIFGPLSGNASLGFSGDVTEEVRNLLARSYTDIAFWLTPRTALRVSALSTVDALASFSIGAKRYFDVSSGIGLSISNSLDADFIQYRASRDSGFSFSEHRVLTAYMANNQHTAQIVSLTAVANAQVSAIPEPKTMLLMILGLGLCASRRSI